ncbi:hypothetical protein KIPB_002581, partial [Kipferlia bialata]
DHVQDATFDALTCLYRVDIPLDVSLVGYTEATVNVEVGSPDMSTVSSYPLPLYVCQDMLCSEAEADLEALGLSLVDSPSSLSPAAYPKKWLLSGHTERDVLDAFDAPYAVKETDPTAIASVTVSPATLASRVRTSVYVHIVDTDGAAVGSDASDVVTLETVRIDTASATTYTLEWDQDTQSNTVALELSQDSYAKVYLNGSLIHDDGTILTVSDVFTRPVVYAHSDNASSAEGDRFGTSVAMYGTEWMIGAPGAKTAYIQSLNADGVVETTHEYVWDVPARFGSAVGAAKDWMVAAGYGDGGKCRVHFYSKATGEWDHVCDRETSVGSTDSMGVSLALYEDRLAVGCMGSEDGLDLGVVGVFEPSSSGRSWNLQAEIEGPESDLYFGHSVDLDISGDVALLSVGGAGKAYIYAETAPGVWPDSPDATIDTDEEGEDDNGSLLSVSMDLGTLVVGVPLKEKVEVYAVSDDGTATYTSAFQSYSDTDTSLYGQEVKLYGNTLLVGIPGRRTDSGGIWVYQRYSTTGWSTITYHDAYNSEQLGSTLDISEGRMVAGLPGGTDGVGGVVMWDSEFKIPSSPEMIGGYTDLWLKPVRDSAGEVVTNTSVNVGVNGVYNSCTLDAEAELYESTRTLSYPPGRGSIGYYTKNQETTHTITTAHWHTLTILFGPTFRVDVLPCLLSGPSVEVVLYNENNWPITDSARQVSVSWSDHPSSSPVEAEWNEDFLFHSAPLSPSLYLADSTTDLSAPLDVYVTSDEYGTITVPSGTVAPLFSTLNLYEQGIVTVAPTSFPTGVQSMVEVTVSDYLGRTVGGYNAPVTVSAGGLTDTAMWDQTETAFISEATVTEIGTLQVVYEGSAILSEPDIYPFSPFSIVSEVGQATTGLVTSDEDIAFGYSVAVSGDWAAVGAPDYGSERGAVFIYHRTKSSKESVDSTKDESDADTGNWVYAQKLYSNQDMQGLAMAMDGEWLAVTGLGTSYEDVVIYRLDEESQTWSRQQVLRYSVVEAGEDDMDTFPQPVSLRGSLLCVGRERDRYETGGALYIYELVGIVWQSIHRFGLDEIVSTDDLASAESLGQTVYTDGDRFAVGAQVAGEDYLYLIERDESDAFSVVLSATGSYMAVSGGYVAVSRISSTDASGVVDIYSLSSSQSWELAQSLSSEGDGEEVFGFALYFERDTLVVAGGDPSLSVYQLQSASAQWERVFGASVLGLPSSPYGVSLDRATLIAHTADNRVALFDSDWLEYTPSGFDLSVLAANAGVSLTVAADTADLYIPETTAVEVEIESQSGVFTLPAVTSESDSSADCVWMSDNDWIFPSEPVLFSLSGIQYSSDYVTVLPHTVYGVTYASKGLPSLVIEENTGSEDVITGVSLSGDTSTFTVGTPAQVVIGDEQQGSVELSATVADSVDLYAALDSPFAIPATWQQGADGEYLPLAVEVTLSTSEGVVATQAGFGWVRGSSSSAPSPIRGEVVSQDSAAVPRGQCSQASIALYDADGTLVSCAADGVSFTQPETEPLEQYFSYSLANVETVSCTLHFCVPSNAPVNAHFDVVSDGKTLVSIPVAVAREEGLPFVSLRSIADMAVALLLIVGGCLALALLTKNTAPPAPDVANSSAVTGRVYALVFATHFAGLVAIKLLSLGVNLFVILRFCGLFRSISLASSLSSVPVLKWSVGIAEWLDGLCSRFVQGIVDSSASGAFVVLSYVVFGVLLVLVTGVNWRLCALQVASERKTLIYVYPIVYTLRAVAVVASCLISDVALWLLVVGVGFMTTPVVVICGLGACLTYLIVTFFGDELGILFAFSERALPTGIVFKWAAKSNKGARIPWRYAIGVMAIPSHCCYLLLAPVTHSLCYILQTVGGVYERLSPRVEHIASLAISGALALSLSLWLFPCAPGAAWISLFALASSAGFTVYNAWGSESDDSVHQFDPYALSMTKVAELHRRVWDLRKDAILQDPTAAERYVELNASLRSASLLSFPLVGPLLAITAETLSSPPLRVPMHRRYPLGYTANVLSLLCLFGIVILPSGDTLFNTLRGVCVLSLILLQLYDATQHGRMLARRFRRAPFHACTAPEGHGDGAEMRRWSRQFVEQAKTSIPVVRRLTDPAYVPKQEAFRGVKLSPVQSPPPMVGPTPGSASGRSAPPAPPPRRQAGAMEPVAEDSHRRSRCRSSAITPLQTNSREGRRIDRCCAVSVVERGTAMSSGLSSAVESVTPILQPVSVHSQQSVPQMSVPEADIFSHSVSEDPNPVLDCAVPPAPLVPPVDPTASALDWKTGTLVGEGEGEGVKEDTPLLAFARHPGDAPGNPSTGDMSHDE